MRKFAAPLLACGVFLAGLTTLFAPMRLEPGAVIPRGLRVAAGGQS
jgi:hypothetical protein